MSPTKMACEESLVTRPFEDHVLRRSQHPFRDQCLADSVVRRPLGRVGAGKTVAVRAAVSSLDPTRHQVIYIASRVRHRGRAPRS